jgi:hypothetical protein
MATPEGLSHHSSERIADHERRFAGEETVKEFRHIVGAALDGEAPSRSVLRSIGF